MRAATDLLSGYAQYHRDQRNIASHFVGVPMIVFATGVLLARPEFTLGGLVLSPAWILFVLAAAWYFLYRWQQTPKVADLLIETEAELRKVTWPTMSEAINSSIVVIACVVFLMAFLAGADWLLGRWTSFILTGG